MRECVYIWSSVPADKKRDVFCRENHNGTKTYIHQWITSTLRYTIPTKKILQCLFNLVKKKFPLGTLSTLKILRRGFPGADQRSWVHILFYRERTNKTMYGVNWIQSLQKDPPGLDQCIRTLPSLGRVVYYLSFGLFTLHAFLELRSNDQTFSLPGTLFLTSSKTFVIRR